MQRTYAPLDWNGAEAAGIIHTWPVRNERHSCSLSKQRSWRPDYFTAAHNIGVNIRCNAGSPFHFNSERTQVDKPAGTSKRCSSFYHKTGVLAHRTEPAYRETKGAHGLTETHSKAGRNFDPWRSLTCSPPRVPGRRTRSQDPDDITISSLPATRHWDWEPLPMYRTTNHATYYLQSQGPFAPPAGKLW
eukprot:GEMP01053897.1.p1 GENE.GEMP01053897.1~~GEMP01053897.1.p1  ORF type:complete len:217 (+),score=14.55 GEMP01053897.1:86-652(+)